MREGGRLRWAGVLVLAGALALGAAACGVPVQGRPVALSANQIPSGLSEAATTTTIRGSSTPVSIVQVYFVAGDRLVPRSRVVPAPGALPELLASLLAGPTPSESAAGIRTAISPDTELLDEHVVKDRAVIDLSPTFTDTGGPDQILAIGQFVYTAGSLGSGTINQVSFEIGGSPVAVPIANGTLESGPVDQADYASLLSSAPQTSPPGTAPGGAGAL